MAQCLTVTISHCSVKTSNDVITQTPHDSVQGLKVSDTKDLCEIQMASPHKGGVPNTRGVVT